MEIKKGFKTSELIVFLLLYGRSCLNGTPMPTGAALDAAQQQVVNIATALHNLGAGTDGVYWIGGLYILGRVVEKTVTRWKSGA